MTTISPDCSMKWMGGIQVVIMAACGLYVGYMIRFACFVLVWYTV